MTAPLQRPTFLGIGAMRAGTTWVYEVLKCHPEIELSTRKKLDYFFLPQMLQHDLDWYSDQFPSSNGVAPRPIRGEISPRYSRLKAWQVRRVAEWLLDLKLILILRNLIERFWSQAQYDFGDLSGRDLSHVSSLEFLQLVERFRASLASDFFRTVTIWTRALGKGAFHIDLFDRLRSDPAGFVNYVLVHLGARTPWALPEISWNERSTPPGV